jgi:hypothetical protein
MNEPESTKGMARSTEQIANAGVRSEDQAGWGQDSLPDTQTREQARAEQQGQASAQQAMPGSDPGTSGQPHAQLLGDHELQSIRAQWKDIQAEFVDEPRTAVQNADALVAELMQRLAQMFASEREELESRWAGGDEVSTEDLRHGLRRYRSFFERLLAA